MAGVNTSKITAKDATGLSLADDSGTTHVTLADGGNVGVGLTDPETKLHIQNGSAGTIATTSGALLTLESNEKPKIHFQSPNAYGGSIIFGSVADNDEGQIDYDHGSDRFLFKTGGNTKVTILGDDVGIGVSAPAAKLDVTEGSSDENMRLSYDANNYASFNVDSNGALTVQTVDQGAAASQADLTFDVDGQITMSTGTTVAAGGGFDGAPTLTPRVAKVNGIIETTILVDIEGLRGSSQEGRVVGEAGVAAAYITQITTAVNGVIFKAEVSCIETPVVSGGTNNPDLDLVAAPTSYAQGADFTAGSGESSLVICGGTGWESGHNEKSNNGPGGGTALSVTNNDYLYLVTGDAHGHDTNNFSAGKFIIKLFGANF